MDLDPVQFDIVGGCQLLCVGCPSASLTRKVKMIEPSFFRDCLHNIDVDRIGVFRCFSFGEPLLHRQLPEIFSVLGEFRANRVPINVVEVSTNAQTINWDQLETVLRMRVMDRLVVSCDGDGTPASYERLRPPSRWHRLIEFLERVGGLKEREGLTLELMTRTIVEDPAHCERWTDILVPRGWTPDFRAWKYLPQSPRNMTGRPVQPSDGACMFVERDAQLYVDADGTVVPCCVHPRAAVWGNLGTTKYSEIVRGSLRADFVRDLTETRHALSICSICEYGPAARPGPSAGNRVPPISLPVNA